MILPSFTCGEPVRLRRDNTCSRSIPSARRLVILGCSSCRAQPVMSAPSDHGIVIQRPFTLIPTLEPFSFQPACKFPAITEKTNNKMDGIISRRSAATVVKSNAPWASAPRGAAYDSVKNPNGLISLASASNVRDRPVSSPEELFANDHRGWL
jgi:hypothetical protein